MKLAIYIDSENAQDIKDLKAICSAINSDKTSSEDLKRYINKVVADAVKSQFINSSDTKPL